MDPNLTTAIVSASASALVAIVAIVNNNKRFDDFNARFNDMNGRLTEVSQRITRLENKIDHIEQLLVGYALDVARIKEKLGIS